MDATAEHRAPAALPVRERQRACVNGSALALPEGKEDERSCPLRAPSYRRAAMNAPLTATATPTATALRLLAQFDDDVWLTPMEIASKFEYTTARPILKAIRRGELKAHRSPCGRKLLVRPADYLRWCDEELLYTPPAGKDTSARVGLPNGSPAKPRRSMPTLNYTDQEQR